MTMTAEAALEGEARQIGGWIRPQPGNGQAQPHLRTIGPEGPAFHAPEGAGQVIHRAAEAPCDLGDGQVRRRMRADEESGLADEFVAGTALSSHSAGRLAHRVSPPPENSDH